MKRWLVAIVMTLLVGACAPSDPAAPSAGGTQAGGAQALVDAGEDRPDEAGELTPAAKDAKQVVRSFSGRSIAYVPGRSAGLYEASGERFTTIAVEQPGEDASETFRLRGDFEPEAFSTDETKLFLIEHLSPVRYRVRMLKLHSGNVAPIGRLTKFAPEAMRGTGRVQVYAPTGDALYTLYTRQPPNTAHRSLASFHDHGQVHAFVHVLSLEEGWAHCVDLKMPFGMNPKAVNEIAVSKDGTFVYASDGEQVAVIDTYELKVWDMMPASSIAEATNSELIRPSDQTFMRSH